VSRTALSDEEQIVRAVFSNDWDGERIFSQTFTGPETSISRLKIRSLTLQWEIFRKFQRPPNRELDLFLEIGVGTLKRVAANWKAKPTKLSVVEDPQPDNPAHGLILESMSAGLAKEIIKNCQRHDE
jgi:hypothetical protein